MVGHLPLSVLAAQWLSQILRAVADRAWMFAYGRIPVHLLIPEPQWAVRRPAVPRFIWGLLIDIFIPVAYLGATVEQGSVQTIRHSSGQHRFQHFSPCGRPTTLQLVLLPQGTSRDNQETSRQRCWK